jgi:phosphatidylglycerol:prolipoprotein diacylglycerol transferase
MRPILFEININNISMPIYSYEFFLILSIIVAISMSFIIFKKNGVGWGRSLLGIIIILISTVIGARLFSILYKYPYYITDIGKIFSLRFGDFSLLGGLVFCILSGYVFLKLTKQNILKIYDSLMFLVVAIIILWRIGCFLNGCCIGEETVSIFGISYPNTENIVYPTQIYEIITVFLILIILFFIRKRIKRQGFLSLIFYSSFITSYMVISLFRQHTFYGLMLSVSFSAILLGMVIIIGITEIRSNKINNF